MTPINLTVDDDDAVGLQVAEGGGSGGGAVWSVDGKTGDVAVLPTGGTTGQVLKKSSGTDYDVEWANESGGGGSSPSPSSATPQPLGTASAGSSTDYSRADHVHDFPSDFKTALLQLAAKVAYIDDGGSDYYYDLYDALYHAVAYSVTNALSGCTSSNASQSASTTRPYTATLTASEGYTLTGAAVSVTMGGVDITDTAYSNGEISIASVTGNISITATAVPAGAQYTGYTNVGSATITDNVLTVESGKFIKMNTEFNPGNNPWRITCKYRNTSGTYANYTDIFGSVDSSNGSYRSVLLEITSNNGRTMSMYLSSTGASWDIGSGLDTQATYIPAGQNVWVWIDFSFDGTAYILKHSTDGETYTTGKTYASTAKVKGGYPIGFGMSRNGYLQGEIDLSECKVWINDALYWSAV